MKKTGFREETLGTDAFASLSFEAQTLYFHLAVAADGARVVAKPKRILRGIGASEEALDALISERYIAMREDGTCRVLEGKKAEERKERTRAQTRERVRRYRERKRAERARAAEIALHSVTSLAPSFLPPSSPSLPSPTPLSNTPPITPLKISSTQENLSSSSFWGARVQAMAKHFWDRSLRRYELKEVLWLADLLVRRRGGEEEMCEDDMELLEIAFGASADAGACSIAYLRGVYANWYRGGILTSDEYWENEVRRDGVIS